MRRARRGVVADDEKIVWKIRRFWLSNAIVKSPPPPLFRELHAPSVLKHCQHGI